MIVLAMARLGKRRILIDKSSNQRKILSKNWGGARELCSRRMAVVMVVQGYLTCKKTHPTRTLP